MIGDSQIEDSQFTLIAGDNGTGKTLFLEAYAAAKIVSSRKLIEKIEEMTIGFEKIDIKIINSDLNRISEDILTSKNKRDSKGFIPRFNVKFQISDPDFFGDYFFKDIEGLSTAIKKEISQEVLYSTKEDLSLEIVDIPIINSIYEFNIDFRVSRDTIYIEYFETGKLCQENIDLIKGFEGPNTDVGMMGDSEQHSKRELEKNVIDSLKPVFFNQNELEIKLTQALKKLLFKIIFKDEIFENGVLFIPSERVTRIDNVLEEVLSSPRTDTGLRYSENIYGKEQLNFSRLMSKFYSPGVFFKDLFENVEEMIGGEIKIEDGEIIGLTDINGNEISRKLFSTKQNRILPYLLIHNPFRSQSLIIIEEPEAHLSIDGMRDLVKYLEFLLLSGRKIIVTTHNEILLQLLNNSILSDNNITSSAYEMKLDKGMSNLVKVVKGDYGYSFAIMTKGLELIFAETRLLHEKIMMGSREENK